MGDVLRQSLVLTLVGVVPGLAGAAVITRYLEGLLFGVTPLDRAVFLGVTILFVLVAMVATYAPARRAASVDPVVALRAE
jgi:putative ABC transport system permease protein